MGAEERRVNVSKEQEEGWSLMAHVYEAVSGGEKVQRKSKKPKTEKNRRIKKRVRSMGRI